MDNSRPDPMFYLDLPVLCIWGEGDRWVPLEQGREVAQIITRAELEIIPGEGHCPMETAPDQFNDLLLDFLQRTQI